MLLQIFHDFIHDYIQVVIDFRLALGDDWNYGVLIVDNMHINHELQLLNEFADAAAPAFLDILDRDRADELYGLRLVENVFDYQAIYEVHE